MYWQAAASLFGDATTVVPSNWSWRLVAPVVAGGLAPLAVAASGGLDDSQRVLLLVASGVASLFSLVCMGFLRRDETFFSLKKTFTVLGKNVFNLPRWGIVAAAGTLVLCCVGGINVLVAAKDANSAPTSAPQSGAIGSRAGQTQPKVGTEEKP